MPRPTFASPDAYIAAQPETVSAPPSAERCPSERPRGGRVQNQTRNLRSHGKGTVRFPLTGRVPVGLIARIAKFRAPEAATGA